MDYLVDNKYIEDNIERKLRELELLNLKELDPKLQVRLIEIEKFITSNDFEIKQHIKELRKRMLNISLVANQESVSVTRKTIYNEPVLEKYIKKSIQEEQDYFNDRAIKELKNNLNNLSEKYNKYISNVLNFKLLQLKEKKYLEQVQSLQEELYRTKEVISEKEELIDILRANQKSNILKFNK